jgi:hypothetical protein
MSEITDTGKLGDTSKGFMLVGVFDMPENINTVSLCGYSSVPEALAELPELVLFPHAVNRVTNITQRSVVTKIFFLLIFSSKYF